MRRRIASLSMASITLLLTLVIALAGGSRAVHAQPGRQATVTYQLRMPTAEERICLNQTTRIPLRIEAIFSVSGDVDAAPVTVWGITLEATSANASVVTVDLSGATANPTYDQPLRAGLSLTAHTVGSTTVTVRAAVHSSGDAPARLEATMPVRVVVCEYQVNISSLWTPRLHEADYVVNVNVRNIRVTGTGGTTLENNPNMGASPPLEWQMTINRIRGCEVGHPHQSQRAPRIRAEIGDESLNVTVTYERLTPLEPYYREACRVDHPFQHSAPCYEHRDGICFVWDDGPSDWFHPATTQFSVPLDGGSVIVQHPLRHAWGNIDGGTIITVTPIR